MREKWITSFQEWLRINQARLKYEGIRVEVIGITSYRPSSIHVNFYADGYESTVELWEDGQSDFHWLDWEAAKRDPEVGVVVTHFNFSEVSELYRSLDEILNRMSPLLA